LHSRQVLRIPILAAVALTVALAIATVASGAVTLEITDGPPPQTRDTTPAFSFSVGAEAASVTCSIDQGTESYGPCSGPSSHTSASPLADGTYTFRVRASDATADPPTVATRTFTVDTDAPSVSIASGTTGPTADPTPSFAFNGETGATLECSIDQGSPSFELCELGTYTPPTLPDGNYTFRVRATDAAGNTSTATRAFRVDTVAPETTIGSQPLGTTDDQSPDFLFTASESGVTFQCRLDGPTYTACSSPRTYGPLDEGQHTFAVRATDAAGNVGAEDVEAFTVDLTNPELAIVSGPEGATPDNTPTFGFDAEGGTTVECSVDQGTASWGSCSGGESHAVASPLADGDYTFRVRASDGPNETIETQPFSVDTDFPETSLDGDPSGLINTANPSFAFSADESGTSFQCRRDSEPSFAPCSSPKSYEGLPDGPHTFQVRAVDAAGNVDPSASSVSFSIDTVAPVVSITFGPLGITTDDSPLFEFSVSGASATACSIDQGVPAFGPCSSATSHVVARRLTPGAYAFRVRGTDPAGNATTATRSFAVAGPAPPAQPPVIATTPRLMSPFPLVRLTGSLTRRGAKVRVLSVRAPRGALVRVDVKPKCAKGRRCPAKRGRSTVGAKGTVRFKKLELGYRAGTVIQVRVSQAGSIGKYTRFVVRRGKTPQRVDRCLMPGAARGSACPAG
jgi:hypothetical protein